jgi:hypothetical protein
MSESWKKWGHSVTAGPVQSITSGVGIMHIDRTKVSPELIPATQLPLLNGKVLDISKHLFSKLRVFPDDPWNGPVIVKSDLNFFGNPERPSHSLGYLERAQQQLANRCWKLARLLPKNNYPILDHVSEVPKWVWKRKDLIVERFIPEKHEDLFSIKGWVFFGDRGYTYQLFSKSPIVKAGSITHYEILDSVPQELIELRKAYQYDFGKFDYVEVDGRAVVIDMNKTPTTIAKYDSPLMLDLAEGIYSFI